MKRYAVIVAGGSGSRMGGGIPKQFRSLNGKPLLWWSMNAFRLENKETEIILVLPETFIELWKDFFETLSVDDRIPHSIAQGGNSRTESVKNGLKLIDGDDSLVAVHDAARPLVTVKMISEGWKCARDSGAAVPVVKVTDSLRRLEGESNKSVNRADYVAVQTPQVFLTSLLRDSYENSEGGEFTDDASVVEYSGHEIRLFDGDPSNLKVTNPDDMTFAEILMQRNG